MGSRFPRMSTIAILAVAIALMSLSLLTAAKKLAPRTEQMAANEARVDVDYTPSASAEDLGIPFYPGAEVKDSFVYTVRTPDSKQVLYYASAVLSSADPPGKVASHYHDALPGRPQAETLKGDAAERLVLAVSQGDEVKMVTITAADGGSRIELVRATKPAVPPRPLRPKGAERVT
jgi:hypothetical protein